MGRPRVAISLGDPRGVGPEVVHEALRDARVKAALEPILFGDAPAHLDDDRACGAAAIEAVDAAMRAVHEGRADALCTAPLSKHRVALVRPGFVGHTEHLAAFTGARVAMMMAGPRLRVV